MRRRRGLTLFLAQRASTSPLRRAPSWTVGYQFKTGGNITVYNLGFDDSGVAPLTYPGNGTATMPDGFTASHAVGIYDFDKGALLVQAIVPQNSTLLDSNFRYAEQLLDGAEKPSPGHIFCPRWERM